MKTKLLLLFVLLVGLATTGSQCVNEGFLISLNLPMSHCYRINAGPNLSFSGDTTITLIDQIDLAYRDHLKNARFYDIRVSTQGTFNGTVNGTAFIKGPSTVNPKPLLKYSGAWSDFATPQSLLGSSPRITLDTAGTHELGRILTQFINDNRITVQLSSSGALSGQLEVPSGLAVCVEILSQVDAEVK